jgi:NADH-quinone oxidoreductase subunit F
LSQLLVEAVTEGREDLALYQSRGGYQGLAKVRGREPAWIVAELKAAGLRGHGGSGKGPLVHEKWLQVKNAGNSTRYVIANGAESSIVSLKDRFLMTHYPHRILEGVLTCAHAVSAAECYLYVRGDSESSIESLTIALTEARGAGLFGPGTDGPDEIHLKTALTTYIAGEETAVVDALEGLEGIPQPKPPYPAEAGLHGCPTVVNSVETMAAVAAILRRGVDLFRAHGTANCPGTALFTVTGDVEQPGVYEAEYGRPLLTLLERAGAPPRAEILAVLPGGLSSGPLRPEELDVPLTFDALIALGSTLGPASLIVLRTGTDLATFTAETAEFLARSSCGQCRGCKDTSRLLAVALHERDYQGSLDLGALLHHGRGNCGHPTGAAQFALRALQSFPEAWNR